MQSSRSQISFDVSGLLELQRPSTSFERTGPIKPQTAFSVTNPPFGLDFDPTKSSFMYGTEVFKAAGFKKGGPKEARLFRVALLKSDRENDHLYPVKVKGIPPKTSPEKLRSLFEERDRKGEVVDVIGDIYIPKNLKNNHNHDFAIVRFKTKEAADKALNALEAKEIEFGARQKKVLEIEPLESQVTTFSKNTGSLGICNAPVGDPNRIAKKEMLKQNISLASCLSRSGYPWGSKQELKLLEPHAPKEVNYAHAIKIENLNKQTSSDTLTQVFSPYGDINHVYCPKPLAVNLRTQDENCGFGFVRFADYRDLEATIKDLNDGAITVDGNIIKGTYQPPAHWPNEKTRRYY